MARDPAPWSWAIVAGGAVATGCASGAPPVAEGAPQASSVDSTAQQPAVGGTVSTASAVAVPVRSSDAPPAPSTAAPSAADGGVVASGVERSVAWAEYPGRVWPSKETGVRFEKERLPACPSAGVERIAQRKFKEIVERLAGCTSPSVDIDPMGGRVEVMGTYTTAGSRRSANRWHGAFTTDGDAPLVPPEELLPAARAIATQLSREQLGCIADIRRGPFFRRGQDAAEIAALVARVDARCTPAKPPQESTTVIVRIDDEGSVTTVQPLRPGKGMPAQLECARRALRGMRAPCLRRRQVLLTHEMHPIPEHVL